MPELETFSPAAAAALGGPDWLDARRQAAAERFASTALPTEAEEVWRYSRISELDLAAYRPVGAAPGATGAIPAEVKRIISAAGPPAGVVVSVDGRIVHTELDQHLAASGVVLGSLTDVEEAAADDILGCAAGEPSEAFGELNAAFLTDPVVLRVPDGVVIERPVLVLHCVGADGLAVFPRTIVEVGRDAQVTVLEHQSSEDVAALVVPVTELDVAQAGRLRYLSVQALGTRVWQVGHQASRVERDATLQASTVALGGDYARLRSDSRLVGQGASSELLAIYFAEGDQMHDFRTLQDHAAPNTTSELLFKGAVEDRARGVYSGLIRVEKQAQKTNAFQTNRNLVLSEGAHADSVPNLEIEANDVRCSHATSVGPIDEDQRYYVESRGLPPEAAERLIVLGFFNEVLARMPLPTLEADLRRAVAAKLQRRSAT